MNINIEHHPCFNDQAKHQFARVHLPVAPKCNIQCQYCNRKYDCANETRPGVTSTILSPRQSLVYLDKVMQTLPNLAVVGIAGPGDPLANPDETLETLRLVKEKYPQLLLCLATNGLNLPLYVDQLAEIAVSHVTITVNAVDPAVGENIYAWVRDGKKVYHGREAAQLLWDRQREGIRLLKAKGIIAKVNSIVIPTVNDSHILTIAETVAELGADIFNAMPLYPTQETAFADIPEPTSSDIQKLRNAASVFLPQMAHCARCRADAVGLIGKDLVDLNKVLKECAQLPRNPEENRPYVAVASMEGVLVNQHLGRAEELLIYAAEESGYRLVAERKAPKLGLGDERWQGLTAVLTDCRAVLVNAAGNKPVEFLKKHGVDVIEMDGLIEEGLEHVFHGSALRGKRLNKNCSCTCDEKSNNKEVSCAQGSGCNSGCGGSGLGCL
jgi:nitrogen fixation protein NifB